MTYKEIQECYKRHFNKSVKTCWIADVKREMGLTTRIAYNRIDNNKVRYPCSDPEIRKRLIKILRKQACPEEIFFNKQGRLKV